MLVRWRKSKYPALVATQVIALVLLAACSSAEARLLGTGPKAVLQLRPHRGCRRSNHMLAIRMRSWSLAILGLLEKALIRHGPAKKCARTPGLPGRILT